MCVTREWYGLLRICFTTRTKSILYNGRISLSTIFDEWYVFADTVTYDTGKHYANMYAHLPRAGQRRRVHRRARRAGQRRRVHRRGERARQRHRVHRRARRARHAINTPGGRRPVAEKTIHTPRGRGSGVRRAESITDPPAGRGSRAGRRKNSIKHQGVEGRAAQNSNKESGWPVSNAPVPARG